MYVIARQSVIVVEKRTARREKIHHTMMHGGGNVVAAGELTVRTNGEVLIDNNSGHYKTPNSCMTAARRLIETSHGLIHVRTVDKRMSNYMKRTLIFRRR